MSNDEQKLTEKQLAILESATELFAEKGFAGTSTSAIAKKANVAEGTIFKHFKSKKGLLLSVISPMIKVVAPMVKKDINKILDRDYELFGDFLRELIDNRIKFVEKHMTLFRVLHQEIPFHPELKEQFIEHIGKDLIGRIKQIIEYYQEKGQIRQIPVKSVTRLVVSTIFGHVITRLLIVGPNEWNEESELENTIQFIMNGIAP